MFTTRPTRRRNGLRATTVWVTAVWLFVATSSQVHASHPATGLPPREPFTAGEHRIITEHTHRALSSTSSNDVALVAALPVPADELVRQSAVAEAAVQTLYSPTLTPEEKTTLLLPVMSFDTYTLPEVGYNPEGIQVPSSDIKTLQYTSLQKYRTSVLVSMPGVGNLEVVFRDMDDDWLITAVNPTGG